MKCADSSGLIENIINPFLNHFISKYLSLRIESTTGNFNLNIRDV